jgi:RNA-binding protein
VRATAKKSTKRRVTGRVSSRAASRAAGKRAKHYRDAKAKKESQAKSAALAPAPVLSSAQRAELKARAHGLEPIVQVGHAGVTDGVVLATRQALLDHELIKVRLHEPKDKQAMAGELATRTLSSLCGLIGHTVILYRPKPKPARATEKSSRQSARSKKRA